jgi:hypothetical protein
MFQVTRSVVAAVFGAGRSDGALAILPAVPAVALCEGVGLAAAAGVGAVRAGVSWLRGRLADGLRAAADVLKPLPVATAASYPVAQVAAPVEAPAPVEEPVILAMPSAAQCTVEEAPAVLPLRPAGEDLAALLEKHGSVRAAARALGVAESTLRGRCKKAGVQLPGRKGKR